MAIRKIAKKKMVTKKVTKATAGKIVKNLPVTKGKLAKRKPLKK